MAKMCGESCEKCGNILYEVNGGIKLHMVNGSRVCEPAAPQSDQRKVTEPLCNDCGRPKDHLYHDASIVGGTQHFFEPIQSDQKCTCNGTTMDAYCAIHGAHVDVESVGNESAQSDQPVEAKEWRLESPPDHGKFKQVFMDAQPSPASADARELAKAILSIYDDPDSIADSAITQGAALLESFRAETLEQVTQHRPQVSVESETYVWEMRCSCGGWQEGGEESWKDHIRSLGSDPTWLARQIAEAKIEEHGEQCDCRYEDGEFHPCPRREELDRALSATKLESGEPQQQPEEMK